MKYLELTETQQKEFADALGKQFPDKDYLHYLQQALKVMNPEIDNSMPTEFQIMNGVAYEARCRAQREWWRTNHYSGIKPTEMKPCCVGNGVATFPNGFTAPFATIVLRNGYTVATLEYGHITYIEDPSYIGYANILQAWFNDRKASHE